MSFEKKKTYTFGRSRSYAYNSNLQLKKKNNENYTFSFATAFLESPEPTMFSMARRVFFLRPIWPKLHRIMYFGRLLQRVPLRPDIAAQAIHIGAPPSQQNDAIETTLPGGDFTGVQTLSNKADQAILPVHIVR